MANIEKSAGTIKVSQPDAEPEIEGWLANLKASTNILQSKSESRKFNLEYNYKLLKFLDDCLENINSLDNKRRNMSKEIGDDGDRTRVLLSEHVDSYTAESQVLINQANQTIDSGEILKKDEKSINSTDNSQKIYFSQDNLSEARDNLANALDVRKKKLVYMAETHDFNSLAGGLLAWLAQSNKTIDSQQRPSDKSQVESLLAQHLNLKSDIENRTPEFASVISDMKAMEKKEAESDNPNIENMEKVAKDITKLQDGLVNLEDKWADRNSYLILAAEVTGFWADCAHAETWLKSVENENSDDDKDLDAKKALQELEQFESNIMAPWSKKFSLLDKMTEYERLEAEKRRQAKIPTPEPELKPEPVSNNFYDTRTKGQKVTKHI